MSILDFLNKMLRVNEKLPDVSNTVPKIYIDPLKYRLYSYDAAMMLLRKIKESVDIVNTTVKAETFFGRLYYILNYLIFLAQFEKKIKFKGELPSMAYVRIVNNIDKTVDDFIERAYNAELAKASKLKTDKSKLGHMLHFLSDLEYHLEYSNDYRNVAEIDMYYKGNLYTANNMETIRKLQEAIQNSYIEEIRPTSNAEQNTIRNAAGIANAPYHTLPTYNFVINKEDLKYEYSGKGDFDKSDFYAISAHSLPVLQNFVDKINIAIQKEIDNNKLPNCVIFNKNNICVDVNILEHSKLHYHPLDYHGKENTCLYTVCIRFKNSYINLFFDTNNTLIRGTFFHTTEIKEIKCTDSIQRISTGYECFFDKGISIRKALLHKNFEKTTLFDYDRDEYHKIVGLLGEKAPKSYSGYMRMKNNNTKNYQKLKEEIEKMF